MRRLYHERWGVNRSWTEGRRSGGPGRRTGAAYVGGCALRKESTEVQLVLWSRLRNCWGLAGFGRTRISCLFGFGGRGECSWRGTGGLRIAGFVHILELGQEGGDRFLDSTNQKYDRERRFSLCPDSLLTSRQARHWLEDP